MLFSVDNFKITALSKTKYETRSKITLKEPVFAFAKGLCFAEF